MPTLNNYKTILRIYGLNLLLAFNQSEIVSNHSQSANNADWL